MPNQIVSSGADGQIVLVGDVLASVPVGGTALPIGVSGDVLQYSGNSVVAAPLPAGTVTYTPPANGATVGAINVQTALDALNAVLAGVGNSILLDGAGADQGTFTHTSGSGIVTNVNYLHTLADNGDGTFTFQPPVGPAITFNGATPLAETVTSLTQTATGFTYTNEAGVISTVTFPPSDPDVLTSIAPTAGGFEYTDEAGNTTVIPINAAGTETVTSIVPTPTGFDYANEAGTVVSIPSVATETVTSVSPTAAGFNYVDEAGSTTAIPIPAQVPETVTTIATSATGFDYTNEAGAVVSAVYPVAPAETVTSIASTPAGFDYVDEAGNTTSIPISAAGPETVTTLVTSPTGFTYTNEAGADVVATYPVAPAETVTTVTATAAGFDYLNEAGATVSVAIPDETLTSVASTPTGFEYTDEAGTTTSIVTPAANLTNTTNGVIDLVNISAGGNSVTVPETLAPTVTLDEISGTGKFRLSSAYDNSVIRIFDTRKTLTVELGQLGPHVINNGAGQFPVYRLYKALGSDFLLEGVTARAGGSVDYELTGVVASPVNLSTDSATTESVVNAAIPDAGATIIGVAITNVNAPGDDFSVVLHFTYAPPSI